MVQVAKQVLRPQAASRQAPYLAGGTANVTGTAIIPHGLPPGRPIRTVIANPAQATAAQLPNESGGLLAYDNGDGTITISCYTLTLVSGTPNTVTTPSLSASPIPINWLVLMD